MISFFPLISPQKISLFPLSLSKFCTNVCYKTTAASVPTTKRSPSTLKGKLIQFGKVKRINKIINKPKLKTKTCVVVPQIRILKLCEWRWAPLSKHKNGTHTMSTPGWSLWFLSIRNNGTSKTAEETEYTWFPFPLSDALIFSTLLLMVVVRHVLRVILAAIKIIILRVILAAIRIIILGVFLAAIIIIIVVIAVVVVIAAAVVVTRMFHLNRSRSRRRRRSDLCRKKSPVQVGKIFRDVSELWSALWVIRPTCLQKRRYLMRNVH